MCVVKQERKLNNGICDAGEKTQKLDASINFAKCNQATKKKEEKRTAKKYYIDDVQCICM